MLCRCSDDLSAVKIIGIQSMDTPCHCVSMFWCMALSSSHFGSILYPEYEQAYAVSEQHRIPDTVANRARELRDEKDFRSIGEAVRHMCQNGGYDV